MTSIETAPTTEITAGGGKEFRVRWTLVSLLAIGTGAWFCYDGWVTYPSHNTRYRELEAKVDELDRRKDEAAAGPLRRELKDLKELHSDSDIRLQRALGLGVPLLGFALLAHMLYHSRGAYRLTDQQLHVPGRPPIARSSIRSIDMSKWDRKGVATVHYDGGAARLDDWHHEQRPTSAIVRTLCNQLGVPFPEKKAAEATA